MKRYAVFQMLFWLASTHAIDRRKRPECHPASSAILPFVANGRSVSITKYPYIVALENTKKDEISCGAVIVGCDVVLTAAHCLEGVEAQDLKVIAGQTVDKTTAGMKVSSFQLHPGREQKPWRNDIAVIFTNESFHWSNSVGKAKLPSFSSSKDFTMKNLTVLGWGLDQDENPPGKLHEANLLGKDPNVCKTHYGSNFTSESMICAGGDGKDACPGDSGGPVVDTISGTVVGLVSYGAGTKKCGQQESVHVMLSSYLEWIQKSIQEITQPFFICEEGTEDTPDECEADLFKLDCKDFDDCFGDCSLDQCESSLFWSF